MCLQGKRLNSLGIFILLKNYFPPLDFLYFFDLAFVRTYVLSLFLFKLESWHRG